MPNKDITAALRATIEEIQSRAIMMNALNASGGEHSVSLSDQLSDFAREHYRKPKEPTLSEVFIGYRDAMIERKDPRFITKGKFSVEKFCDYAYVNKDAWYNLIRDNTAPESDTLLKLFIALRFPLEEAEAFAKMAKHPFDYNDYQTVLVVGLLTLKVYDVEEASAQLYYFQSLENPYFDCIYDKKYEQVERRRDYKERRRKKRDEIVDKLNK